MIAAIVAEPEDDAPRLVYADRLTELGSPRGELIVVQCKLASAALTAPERKKLEARQKTLLKGRAELLGPLADLIFKGSERFERGMLVAMQPQVRSERQRELLDHPLLTTVRDLGLNWILDGQRAAVVTHPNLASLRTVGEIRVKDMPQVFGSDRPLPIVDLEIGVAQDAFTDAERETIAEGRGLPDLRVLRVSFWHDDGTMPSWMVRGAVLRRLERIEAGSSNSSQIPALASWIRSFDAYEVRASLSFAWGGGACTVTDGIVRATNSYANGSPAYTRALREARAVAKEVVREGAWPDAARAEILGS